MSEYYSQKQLSKKRLKKLKYRTSDKCYVMCTCHYTKDPQNKSPFFWYTTPEGEEIESELTFILLGAQPEGDFLNRAPAPLKVFWYGEW